MRVPEDDGAAVGFGVGEQPRIGAPEGEDGLVGIPGEDELLGGEPQPGEEAVLERVEVLGVVDEQVANAVPLLGEQLLVGLEGKHRGGDQLGRVERRRAFLGDGTVRGPRQERDLLVLPREPADGDPLRVLGVLAELDQVLRPEPTLGGTKHEVAKFFGEPGDGERGPEAVGPVVGLVLDVPGEQLADDGVLLRPVQETRPWHVTHEGVQAEHGEGVGVDRAHEGLANGAQGVAGRVVLGDALGDGGPGGRGRPPVGGDDEELLGVDAAAENAVGRDLGEQGGLAGAGPAEHANEPFGPAQHTLRGRLPPERCARRHRPAHEPKIRHVRGHHADDGTTPDSVR